MSSLRILMYCNDSQGSGNTVRTLHIAASLSQALEDCSILVLTDLSSVGRFRLAERVDYVHLPVLETKNDRSHFYNGLNIEPESKLRIRRKIAQSAIKTFHPDVVMLDESLLNHPLEMQRLVACIADLVPEAKVVWEFSDTLGAPEWVTPQWANNGVGEVLKHHAHAIVVLGAQRLFDLAEKYQISESIARKLVYTGYLARHVVPSRRVSRSVAKLNRTLPLVMLCPGGDSNDFAMLDTYLRFLEKGAVDWALQSLIVVTPNLGPRERRALVLRAKKLPNVELHRYSEHTLQYVRFASLVICSGEYNIMCEILEHRKMAMIIPNPKEQPGNFYRAQLFQKQGLVTVLQPPEYHPPALRQNITKLLFSGPRLVQKSRYKEVPLDGFANITETIEQLTGRAKSEPNELRVAC